MGKDAPKAPDPKETAAAQTGTNVTTAIANGYMGNVNQVTPDGKLNYSYTMKTVQDPTTGKSYQVPVATATQSLSKTQQALKNQNDKTQSNLAGVAVEQSGRLGNLLNTPFDTNTLPQGGNAAGIATPQYEQFGAGPDLQTSVGNGGDITKSYGTDYGANVQQVQDALMSRIQPSLDRDRASLEQKLANQGLQPGSEAYNRAVDEASRSANDARYGAIINAGQEQSRLAGLAQNQASFQNQAQAQQYGQGLSSAQFGNQALQQGFQNQNTATAGNNTLQDQSFNAQLTKGTAMDQQRQQALQEAYASRNQPINEITSLLSGSQVTQPSFMNIQGQQMPTVDYAGLVQQNYQNQVGAYNQQQANSGALLGGLASLFTLSDKTAKKNIKKVGSLKGHGLYEYDYKGKHDDGQRHIGVMAQNVEKTRPDAVRKGSDGLRRVNYGALFNAGNE